VKYLVGERGLNLAGVQLALEATERAKAMRERLRDSDGVESRQERERLLDEVDQLMALLGAS
jgi:hypothetical protein